MGVFRAAIEPGNPAIPLPQLDVAAVDVLLRVFDGRVIVGDVQLDPANYVVIVAQEVDAIITHLRTRRRNSSENSIRKESACLFGFRLSP